MQINRLLEIVILLLNNGKVTATELSERFGVSSRTIYRDLEILSSSNIPIYTTRGKDGGISLLDNYTIDKRIVNEKEQKEILAALQSMKAVQVDDNEALLKLSTLFQMNQETSSWIEIDFTDWGTSSVEKEYFELLKKAILQNITVEFHYYNSFRQHGTKEVEPVKMMYKGHHWYLLAFDEIRDDFRVYRLSRIKDLKLLDKHFIRKNSDHFQIEKEEVPMFEMTLLFDKEIAYRVFDMFSDSEMEELENGDMIVRFQFPYGEWPLGFVLSFGACVKVLSPDWLTETVKEELEKIKKSYET